MSIRAAARGEQCSVRRCTGPEGWRSVRKALLYSTVYGTASSEEWAKNRLYITPSESNYKCLNSQGLRIYPHYADFVENSVKMALLQRAHYGIFLKANS